MNGIGEWSLCIWFTHYVLERSGSAREWILLLLLLHLSCAYQRPGAHMMHINLNIFYTHVEHSPAKTIYYMEKQRNKQTKK